MTSSHGVPRPLPPRGRRIRSAPEPAIDLFWDHVYRAGDHLAHWESPDLPPELVALVRAGELAPRSRVLGVGCGAGREERFVADRGHRAVGVDRSLSGLAVAQRRDGDDDSDGGGVAWVRATVLALPFAAATFDLVLDRGCLHVVPRRERRAYVREVARVLRPGGRLLLRAARRDDLDQGIVGLDAAEVERRFGAAFVCRAIRDADLVSPASRLAGVVVDLVRRDGPPATRAARAP